MINTTLTKLGLGSDYNIIKSNKNNVWSNKYKMNEM